MIYRHHQPKGNYKGNDGDDNDDDGSQQKGPRVKKVKWSVIHETLGECMYHTKTFYWIIISQNHHNQVLQSHHNQHLVSSLMLKNKAVNTSFEWSHWIEWEFYERIGMQSISEVNPDDDEKQNKIHKKIEKEKSHFCLNLSNFPSWTQLLPPSSQ